MFQKSKGNFRGNLGILELKKLFDDFASSHLTKKKKQ